ncbi:hypothetical protein F4861DRAFT_539621 [Xylaria intraflava]|nr:hypothetical protein F4861DRAFT_539621 [Xylaria intraflava]
MCVRTHKQFSKCDHVTTTLTNCPTYHRQEQRARGFLACLFRPSRSRTRTNCGRVVPHYLQHDGYCQACTVKKHPLRAQGVGQGALKVRREDALAEEQKQAAWSALQRSERQGHRRKGSNHDVVAVQTSVWVPELYHNPEALAKRDKYAREGGPAPPVSSRPRRGSRSPRKESPLRKESRHRAESSRTRGRTSMQERRSREESRRPERRTTQVPSQRLPTYGGSKPMMKPAQPARTYQYSGRFAQGAASLPPAVGLPPLPQQYDRTRTARAQAPPTRQSEPSRKPDEAPEPEKKQRTPYEMYVAAMAEAGHPNEPFLFEPPNNPWNRKPSPPPEPSRWETKKAAVSNWIGKNVLATDKDSDVSFVCRSAKVLSEPPVNTRRRSRK